MTPVRLSHIWYRRLYAGLFFVSLGYVVLYALQATSATPVSETIALELLPAAISAGAMIASLVLFFIAKRVSSYWPGYAVFIALAIVTAYAVQGTGGVDSHLLVIWALVAFTAPVFGAYGWLPVIVMAGSYIAGVYLTEGLSLDTLTVIIVSSIVPLIAGAILWRETPDSDSNDSRSVKHLANQLSEVATKSEIVINAIGDGVIAVDGTGVVQLINPAGQQILGWGKQDALLLSYKSILKLTDEQSNELDPSRDPIEQVLNTNQQARGSKLTAITNSGKKISIAVVASPIGDPGSGAIAVFRDVTNERAEEREQAEFISTASHEMRTPVASIEGYLGLALNPQTATIDSKARDFIMKAHEAAQHLGRLFQDLLDVSKSEDGRMTNVPRVLDLVPFTETIVQGLTQKAHDKGLELTFAPGESNGTERGIKNVMPAYFVNLDNDHIREVLDNLIENAIKYTPQGSVRVDVNGTDNHVTVSITDTGLGIPTEDIPHLFQKFYRVENIDRQSIGGTGLGLYLCRRLVEAMQGRLWVESTFGNGSTFFVELPRIDSQEALRLKAMQEQQQAIAPQPVAPPAPVPAPVPTPIPVTFADTPAAAQPTAPAMPLAPAPAPVAAILPQAPPQQAPVTGPVALGPQQAQVAPTPVTPTVQQVAAQPTMPAPVAAPPAPAVKPATTVPRGESLTREQINERVRQLEALAQQQRGSVAPPPRQ